MTLEIRRPRDADERERAFALRHEVFVVEQGVSPEEEVDDSDANAIHLVAVDADGRVRGTCRVLGAGGPVMRVGRLCVAREFRRSGIGAALLEAAEQEARAAGASQLAMNAQTSAASLYRALGYETCGEPFEEVGIEHVAMEKPLA